MKNFTLKSLATSVSLIMASLVSHQAHASDIEIYKVPDQTQTTILMMIDVSGSMQYCDGAPNFKESTAFPENYRVYTNPKNNGTGNTRKTSKLGVTYDMPYCILNNKGYYARYSRLRDAIITLMDSDQLDSSIHLAVGTFHNGKTGKIAIEAKPLDKNHKIAIQNFIAKQTFGSSTPTATAYIEAAAYMLGKTTQLSGIVQTGTTRPSKELYLQTSGSQGNRQWKKCIQWDGDTNNCSARGFTSYAPMVYENDPTGKNSSYGQNMPLNHYTITQCRSSSNSNLSCLTATPKELFAPDPNNPNLWNECTTWSTINPDSCLGYAQYHPNNPNPTLGRYPWRIDKTKNITTPKDGFLPYSDYIEISCGAAGMKGIGSGICLVHKDSQAITPTFDLGEWSKNYSGFSSSVTTSKNITTNTYDSPLPTQTSQCNGQAIYYLLDGNADNTQPTQFAIRNLLNDTSFPIDNAIFAGTGYLNGTSNGLAQVGELSKRLNDPTKNPSGTSIKTAIVGFGTVFQEASNNKTQLVTPEGKNRTYYNCSMISDARIKNVCNWGEKSHINLPGVGGYGEGGFFHATNAQDIVDSFLQVTADTKVEFDPIATGSPTIPIDSLNQQSFVSNAYYASFIPRPETLNQLWLGNINKYDISNGRLVGQSNQALFQNTGLIDQSARDLWGGGTTEHLPLQKDAKNEFKRAIYTNRTAAVANAQTNGSVLQRISVRSFENGGFLSQDANKNYLLNLLGYNVAPNTTVNLNQLPTAELRQMGATIHSKPILLTQEGKIGISGGNLTTTNRKDYLLYGSTQGLLHIIDVRSGEEKFAFLPDEMVKNQKEAFLHKDSTQNGVANLFYGIDGQWTNLTQYVAKADGTLTVNQAEVAQEAYGNTTNLPPVHLRGFAVGVRWITHGG